MLSLEKECDMQVDIPSVEISPEAEALSLELECDMQVTVYSPSPLPWTEMSEVDCDKDTEVSSADIAATPVLKVDIPWDEEEEGVDPSWARESETASCIAEPTTAATEVELVVEEAVQRDCAELGVQANNDVGYDVEVEIEEVRAVEPSLPAVVVSATVTEEGVDEDCANWGVQEEVPEDFDLEVKVLVVEARTVLTVESPQSDTMSVADCDLEESERVESDFDSHSGCDREKEHQAAHDENSHCASGNNGPKLQIDNLNDLPEGYTQPHYVKHAQPIDFELIMSPQPNPTWIYHKESNEQNCERTEYVTVCLRQAAQEEAAAVAGQNADWLPLDHPDVSSPPVRSRNRDSDYRISDSFEPPNSTVSQSSPPPLCSVGEENNKDPQQADQLLMEELRNLTNTDVQAMSSVTCMASQSGPAKDAEFTSTDQTFSSFTAPIGDGEKMRRPDSLISDHSQKSDGPKSESFWGWFAFCGCACDDRAAERRRTMGTSI